MEIRNQTVNSHGTIDCEINHPEHGWIPFTAAPDDSGSIGPELYLAILNGEHGPITPYAPPEKTGEEIQRELTSALQQYLDAEAIKRGYDNIRSAALRAGYPGPFHDEGVVMATWMDTCWATGYAILADVVAGSRPIPSGRELLAALPKLELP